MPASTYRTRLASYGIVVEAERVLLCRISTQLPEHAGSWTLPGGGIEFGEAPEAAMIREVHEETGLVVEAAGFAGVDSAIIDGRDGKPMHGVRFLYFAKVTGGALSHECNGTTDLCAWHPLDDIAGLTVVPLVEIGLQYARAAARTGDPGAPATRTRLT